MRSWDDIENDPSATGEYIEALATENAIDPSPFCCRDPATIPPRPWLYGRWLLRGTVGLIIAPGGVGKTTFVNSTALALVTAMPLLGKTVWDGPKRVWIWNLEDDMDELSRSIAAAMLHHRIDQRDVHSRLFVDSAMEGQSLCTATEEDGFKLLTPIYEAMREALSRKRIDVLIVDPFVSSHEVDESANIKIDKIVKAWGRVAKGAGCAVVLVHHTSKAGAGEVNVLSARGAKALTDAARTALVLNRMDKERAEQLGFNDDDRRSYFSVEDDKHNRAPAEKADWYRLVPVEIANGDSVGVVEPWSLPNPFDNITPDHISRVQIALADGVYRENVQAEDWAGHAVGDVLGVDTTTKAGRSRIKMILRTWIEGGVLAIGETKVDGKPKKTIEVGRLVAPSPPRQGGGLEVA